MIFIHQDESKIPATWLKKVKHLQKELEKLSDAAARKAFIEKHSRVWGDIKAQLLEMSSGKCWYSEAPDAVSDWHVDHFRPKKRALDEDGTEHEGYHWLAFDWKNYRIAGSYPNSPHHDDQGGTRGKWDYFPLAEGSPRASWDNRDHSQETCLLLDPTERSDPRLMTFDEKGVPIPVAPTNAVVRKRVDTTVRLLHLDHARLVRARRRTWLDTQYFIDEHLDDCPSNIEQCTSLDYQRVARFMHRLSELAASCRPYAATVRACIRANNLQA